MRRGEVWWVERPGRGRRPYLVLTRDAAIPVLSRVVAVPVTGTIRGIPTEVGLGPDDGMPQECALSLDNIAAVRRAHFVERICRLQPARMRRVCRALAIATDCAN